MIGLERPPLSTDVAAVDGCLHQIDCLDGEIAILERGIAAHALVSEAIKRLMTVPGVSLMTAAAFIAADGGP